LKGLAADLGIVAGRWAPLAADPPRLPRPYLMSCLALRTGPNPTGHPDDVREVE
jgi:hypothetical protein